jgi:hypothetical protein
MVVWGLLFCRRVSVQLAMQRNEAHGAHALIILLQLFEGGIGWWAGGVHLVSGVKPKFLVPCNGCSSVLLFG